MDTVLDRARAGDDRAFGELTVPFLGELRLHCYRILGSVQDAEDVLQETLLAAWRGLGGFEERASLRTWLYRIATNRCLNALRASARRPRPVPAGPSWASEPTRQGEPLWLSPFPDALLDEVPDLVVGPEARYEAQETIALAFVAAVQKLPPRQRAALVLRDVLGFRSSEAADMLEVSEASVNSALQRARATMERSLPGPDRERAPLPRSLKEREVASRFAAAFAGGDVDGVVSLLTDDAWFTMPPVTLEYQGPVAIARFLRDVAAWRGPRRYQLIPTRANGQLAYGFYVQEPSGTVFGGHGMIVLTLEGDRISAITRFVDNGTMRAFGLPEMLDQARRVLPGLGGFTCGFLVALGGLGLCSAPERGCSCLARRAGAVVRWCGGAGGWCGARAGPWCVRRRVARPGFSCRWRTVPALLGTTAHRPASSRRAGPADPRGRRTGGDGRAGEAASLAMSCRIRESTRAAREARTGAGISPPGQPTPANCIPGPLLRGFRSPRRRSGWRDRQIRRRYRSRRPSLG